MTRRTTRRVMLGAAGAWLLAGMAWAADVPAGPPAETAPGAGTPAVPPSAAPRVAVFTPHGAADTFWTLFVGFMRAAADDLGLVLEVHHAEDSRQRMKQQIRDACTGDDPVDAVVFQSFKQSGLAFLEIADAAGVPAFLVNAGLGPAARAEAGEPRGRFRAWKGEMLPDDEDAGRRLAAALIDRAKEAPSRVDGDGRVHMIALTGVVSDGASVERIRGLRDAVDGREDVVLHQIVPANWRRDTAVRRATVLLRRYPEATVIWAANDPMALGAIEAVRRTGREPGRDVLVGGVDWTPAALDAIERGELACSVGGHFMEGAWVAVLLHDFLLGPDFADVRLSFRSPMMIATRDNVAEVRRFVTPDFWRRLDFRELSRHGAAGRDATDGYRFGAAWLAGRPPRDTRDDE